MRIAKRYRFSLLAALALLAASALLKLAVHDDPKKTTLLVSAAASLKDSLDVIETQYEQAHPDIDLTFNYGSSGTLQKQIEEGAPADLIFSAGKKQMDALVDKGLLSEQRVLLENELVMIVPANSKKTITKIEELSAQDIHKIAIGQPGSVPAGQYAKETLEALKVWDALQDKLVYAKDVRQVLTYVETGNVEAGFVYKTDALVSNKAKVALQILPTLHAPIVYPAGVINESKHGAEAKAFYAYLKSAEAGAAFQKYGFNLAK
ncbi:molybdate ABC transporter substrate-binding protein [Cohnella suwonensis]|uniref:Molybdate ABC transporter substrate-binding protein n=1 Tax=Cohnella suwonensis TaxID=696072 RepID=A0ABW0LNK9_9BACL